MTTDSAAFTEARDQIVQFGAHYAYDVSYLTEFADEAPDAFMAFVRAMPLSGYRKALPKEPHYVARIAAMQALDCGPCFELNLRMALEDGIARELIRRVLEAPLELHAHLQDVRLHVQDVARGLAPAPDRCARLRAAYGKEAFAELATVVAGSQLFPTAKRALEHSKACTPIDWDRL